MEVDIMITYAFLQNYWWFLISLLAGILVFLLFVQGANSQIFSLGKSEMERIMIINSTGRKWEFTFTTLVTFGGAFFASFPLFYSTSFGGAYWVWVLILLTFVLHAVSYEFQSHIGNVKLVKMFRIFLVINGLLAPFLIGAAVSTFFTGSDFTVNKDAMGSIAPVISEWGNNWHGLDALSDIRNWVFGFMLVFLSMTLGLLYMLNNIDNKEFNEKIRLRLRIVAPCFVAFFISTIVFIFMSDGFAVDNDGVVFVENYKYLHNMLEMPLVFVVFIIGTLLVLAGIAMALFCDKKYKKGIFPAGLGTVMVVISLFLIAGYNNTAFYPSYSDIQSSLTIQNSSSSLFTLKTMSIVSLLIPFVLAYIIYAWYSIDKKSITVDEMKETEERY